MTSPEIVKSYINHLCHETGTTADAIYNPKTGAWYFARGSSTIEVFMTSYETGEKTIRTFLRCFAPLHVLPANIVQKLDFLESALAINTQYTRIKLGITDKGLLCAIGERDIEGMDYTEMITLITDVGYRADQLDDFLKKKFSK
jgi:hypothetical protein